MPPPRMAIEVGGILGLRTGTKVGKRKVLVCYALSMVLLRFHKLGCLRVVHTC